GRRHAAGRQRGDGGQRPHPARPRRLHLAGGRARRRRRGIARHAARPRDARQGRQVTPPHFQHTSTRFIMKRLTTQLIGAALLLAAPPSSEALARGFGAVRGGGVAVGARGGVAAGGYRAGAAVGPYGGVGAGGARGGTYVGPRGTTVQAGRAGGVGVG